MASGSTLERNPGVSAVIETSNLVTQLTGSSTAVGWQSQVFSDITTRACDYQISLTLAVGKSTPAGDKAIYCYIVPWYYNGSTWWASYGTNFSYSSTGGAITLVQPSPNLGSPKVFSVNIANDVVGGNFNIAPFVGDPLPDGFQLVLINNSTCCVLGSGQALSNLEYKAIKWNSITT